MASCEGGACRNEDKALCLDLENGSGEDAPLVEVDLTEEHFIDPRPLGKTFREWIEEHEVFAKKFQIAWNRIMTKKKGHELYKGPEELSWRVVIDKVKDYLIGVATLRYNYLLDCVEVDEFLPINQPLVEPDGPIQVLLSEIFSFARDYRGSLKLQFTRDQREDGHIRDSDFLGGFSIRVRLLKSDLCSSS